MTINIPLAYTAKQRVPNPCCILSRIRVASNITFLDRCDLPLSPLPTQAVNVAHYRADTTRKAGTHTKYTIKFCLLLFLLYSGTMSSRTGTENVTKKKQTSRIHPTHYLSFVLTLLSYLRPWLASYTFTAGFSIKIFYALLIPLMPATYHTLLDISTVIKL